MITILIPAYNASRYITKCLSSIGKQSYKEFEVVIVDDCSSDATVSVVEEFKKHVSFPILVIKNSRNLGVSMVRNILLRQVKGEFFYFIDADDFLEANALECLFKIATEKSANIVTADFYLDDEHNLITVHVPADSAESQRKSNIAGKWAVVWRSLYRTSYIEEIGLKFPENINGGEDYFFVSKASVDTDKIIHVSDAFYHYRLSNQNSIMRSVNIQGLSDQFTATKLLEESISEKDKFQDEFYKRYLYLKKETFKTALKSWKWHTEANNIKIIRSFGLKDKIVFFIMSLLSKML